MASPVHRAIRPRSGAGVHKSLENVTPDPVMATPDTCLGELAAMMVEAHIHRVVIVDEHRRPQGIVSSTDILAALARRTNATEGV